MEPRKPEESRTIVQKLGLDPILERLSGSLSLSDLNSLLLEVFRRKAAQTSAGELLKRYASNRFVLPADVNPLELKRLEIALLELAERHAYIPVQLSPVAPLGSCSAVASADQNKIISATRGTEVVADATNALALHICHSIRQGKLNNRVSPVRFSTTHRHVRAQRFAKPGLVPHFHLFCMVVSGRDTGSYAFEKQALLEQLQLYQAVFSKLFNESITVILNRRGGYPDSDGFVRRIFEWLKEQAPDIGIVHNTEQAGNAYYQGLQFTIRVTIGGETLQIGDGGFVDWSQRLLGNKKERMMISAIGMERLIP